MSKLTRLQLLLEAAFKHLKSNRFYYLKSLGNLSKEQYLEAIVWLTIPALRICIGAIKTYRLNQNRKKLDENKTL